jgi:ketosteroid isomerase-like protein
MEETLQRLIDEREIRDVLYRYCRAADRFDVEAMGKTYHEGAVDNHGVFNGPADDFMKFLEQSADMDGPLKMIQHTISNILIELDGDGADVESYFLGYALWQESDGQYDELTGGRYLDRFERRAGRWAIARRDVAYDWSRKSPCTEKFWDRMGGENFQFGRRDKSDPLYTRLKS